MAVQIDELLVDHIHPTRLREAVLDAIALQRRVGALDFRLDARDTLAQAAQSVVTVGNIPLREGRQIELHAPIRDRCCEGRVSRNVSDPDHPRASILERVNAFRKSVDRELLDDQDTPPISFGPGPRSATG